jgi:hypothetical protein
MYIPAGARAHSTALLSDLPVVQITRACANAGTVKELELRTGLRCVSSSYARTCGFRDDSVR